MTKEEAIKKGYLKDSIKVLKPILKPGKMVTDPKHIGYFMWEGASITYVLPQDSRGTLINPFTSDEERKFFEESLGLDLSTNKKGNIFWENEMKVRISKDSTLMGDGIKFDMSDPMDNLRSRVLAVQDHIATSYDDKEQNPHKRFLLVDIAEQEKSTRNELTDNMESFTFFNTIKDSTKKMREFLSVYLNSKKLNKDVPSDTTAEWLTKEIYAVLKTDIKGFLEIATDTDYETKGIISKAVQAGSIVKSGVNTYQIVGEPDKRSYEETISHLKDLKKLQDDIWLKILFSIDDKK